MCRAKVINLVDEHDAPVDFPEVKDLSDYEITPEQSTSPCSEPEIQHTPYVSTAVVPTPMRRGCTDMKPWKQLPTPRPDWMMSQRFEPGFTVSVYDAMLTLHYDIPSENVIPTHGAVRYIEHYNECGPYSRFRFQLCHNFQRGKCHKGSSCTYIHALVGSDETVQRIHLNNGMVYETLPRGASIFVHAPSGLTEPQVIPSEAILRTKGAIEVYNAVINNRSCAILRPQHCAHFQFKKMCNRGTECGFIHSLVPPSGQ